MRVRDLLFSELTVSKRSRRYAEPMDLRWMATTEIETRNRVNEVRTRHKSRRPLLRFWPNRVRRIR